MKHLLRFIAFHFISATFFAVLLSFCNPFTYNGGVLVGYTYKTVLAVDWYDCLSECSSDSRCYSYNYKPKGSLKSCELNSCAFRSKCEAEKALIKDSRFVFHQLKLTETERICQGKKVLHTLPTSQPNQEIKMGVSCSQRVKVFIDGQLRSPGYLSCSLNTTFLFKMNFRPQLIALEGADDTRGQPGLVASLDDNVTDTSWKCSSVTFSGWEKAVYDDHFWPNAVSYCNNSNPRWPLVKAAGISGKAEWIWADQPVANRHVYCRKKLNGNFEPFTNNK